MQPKAKYRKDYKPADFTISNVDLDVQLDPNRTEVVSQLKLIKKN